MLYIVLQKILSDKVFITEILRGKDYLIKRYGKSSRLHLTDAELIEFRDYLKNK